MPQISGGISGIYTIPAGDDFLRALARGLSASMPSETIAEARIYLPTRRACRELTHAFLDVQPGAGMLPVSAPLGDIDTDDLAFTPDGPLDSAAAAALELPPALAGTRRTLMLARLAQAKEAAEHGAAMPLPAALRLGRELGRFLDDLAIDRVDPAKILDIRADEYAEHWQRVLTFLEIVLNAWPKELEAIDRIDPAARREALISAQAAAWRATPPAAPTIIAGSTGAQPGTRDLMAALLAGPNGAVILPGFDNTLDENGFDHIRDASGHPLHAMATALHELGFGPGDVQNWPGATAYDPRAGLVREAMRPASEAESWAEIASGEFAQAVQNLQRVDAATQDEEARAAAIYLREQLHLNTIKGGTPRIALVTPDRGLARRTAAELRRWGIEADDSAGQPLGETPLGAYLRLTARAFRPNAGTADLLAFLKHPLAAGGMDRSKFRQSARALELMVWRNSHLQRQARSLEDTAKVLRTEKQEKTDKPEKIDKHEELAVFCEQVAEAASPLAEALESGDTLRAMLEAHIRVAEAFAATADETGPARLWQGDTGEAAAALLAETLDAADASPPLSGGDYPESFDALIEGAAVRNNRTTGSPVQIMGVLEARLTAFDAVVLGGLDEGIWPRPPAADPWFSRGMRREIGLSDPDKRVGLSAHDFARLLHGPNVLLTRSRIRDSAPTKPSRWLVRLDAVLAADGASGSLLDGQDRYRFLADALDPSVESPPIAPPAPCPPVTARPRRLSATEIERLILDPYAIYARHILELRRLSDLDPSPTPADRGQIVHAALERFLLDHPKKLPADILAALLDAGAKAFEAYADHAEAQAFWRPTFERSARWAAEQEREHRRAFETDYAHAELTGDAEFSAPFAPFKLAARADRIDRSRSNTLGIIDYKTGVPPSKTAIKNADAPQLPLEAAIAKHGAFKDHENQTLAGLGTELLAIWHLAGRDGGKVTAVDGEDAAAAMEIAWNGVQRLIAAFDNPETPYLSEPRAAFGEAPGYSDYRALARLASEVEDG